MSFNASPAWNSTSICAPSAIDAADQALRAEPVRPPDRVRGGEPEREPAEVDQRREDVAVEGEQRHRVHDLGVRRVVRGEEDRVEVVDRPEVGPVGEPGRQRHVVPERVGAIHASGEAGEGRDHPGRGDHGDGDRREPDRAPARRAGGAGGAAVRARGRRSCAQRPVGDAPRARAPPAIIVEISKAANVPSSSASRIRRGDREHGLDHARGRTGPAGEQRRPQPPGGPGERRERSAPARAPRAGRSRRPASARTPGRSRTRGSSPAARLRSRPR